MSHNMFRLARPVKWDNLENFYKNVEEGLEKVVKQNLDSLIAQGFNIFFRDATN